MAIVRFNPVRDLLNVEREFNRLYKEFENRFGFKAARANEEDLNTANWMPLTDIYEDNENYRLKLDLPGINKEDVKISINRGVLSISGERKQENETSGYKFHRVERVYGKFYRSFTLPEKIKEDKIHADFSNGQLSIVIPKAEEAKPKEIQISVN